MEWNLDGDKRTHGESLAKLLKDWWMALTGEVMTSNQTEISEGLRGLSEEQERGKVRESKTDSQASFSQK